MPLDVTRESSPSTKRRLPRSAMLAVVAPGLLSLLCWIAIVVSVPSAPKRLLLLGDSTIANYRLPIGHRLEDVLAHRLGSEWTVRSAAGPGTHPGVFFLNLSEAEFFRFRPDLVVFAFAPRKLGESSPTRYGPSNQDLRWLPVSHEGRTIYEALSPQLRRQAVVDKAGLLFLFVDLIEKPFRDQVTWPRSRARARLEDRAVRDAAIREDAAMHGRRWSDEIEPGTYERFSARENVRDLDLFVNALAQRRIPVVHVMMPQVHPGLGPSTFPPAAYEHLAGIREYVHAWMRARRVPVIDFGTDAHRAAFGPEQWGDIWHLGTAASYRYIGARIVDWIERELPVDGAHASARAR